jgi:hypothetical protein
MLSHPLQLRAKLKMYLVSNHFLLTPNLQMYGKKNL